MIDKHIYFSTEEMLKIRDYSHKHKMTFTSATRELIKIAFENEEVLKRLNTLEVSINSTLKNQKVMLKLLEQLYSDLDFENITNPNDSNTLRIFKNKIKKSILND